MNLRLGDAKGINESNLDVASEGALTKSSKHYIACEANQEINTSQNALETNSQTNTNQVKAIQTISHDDAKQRDDESFHRFIAWLSTTYPAVHTELSVTPLNTFTLLFKWQGKNTQAPAVLFSAHYDVVPVNPGTQSNWQHPPFAGIVENGIIWGRGALDDKSAVVALMESVTLLLSKVYQPEQDTYIALTHDEEIGSREGAQAVTEYFKQQNVALAWSLDEGSFVLDGLVPGSDKRVASINVAEKGYLTIELVAKGEGGHSSMPPQDTAVSVLAEANVLAQTATAKINFRVHPRDTVESVIDWVTRAIDDDRVTINTIRAFTPSNIANTQSEGFNNIASVTRDVHGDVIVTPGLTIAATDSRFYSEITDAYRFNPMTLTPEYLSGFHGTNERIDEKNMVDAVSFYTRLMMHK